ncbi:hypothetical protein NQ318_021301 [Aromia moschata]|uniref:Uncharacterized protein n=1 Tax=Aromia moschata TaxID=1265417 RepID=A0AAV8ZC10_9CUCU|nr:hypothetical protein NQ318_021301 [Aromia moschata]
MTNTTLVEPSTVVDIHLHNTCFHSHIRGHSQRYSLQRYVTTFSTLRSQHRTFSTLKRIKTYLRNSTSQNRLNRLSMMAIPRELPISENEIIDELAKRPRRLDFVI